MGFTAKIGSPVVSPHQFGSNWPTTKLTIGLNFHPARAMLSEIHEAQ